MSKKNDKGNRKGRNASKGGKSSSGGKTSNKGKGVKQGRSVPASRKDLGNGVVRGGYDHARPMDNKTSKRHNSRGITAKKAAGKQNAKVKNMPPGKVPHNKDGKRMVPWVEAPASAQVHHYYFVIREMLEGAMAWEKKDGAHRFGIQQLELHGNKAGSVESLLTQSPRLRRDWRAVVGILRMLHEDDYIPSSFVEKVLNAHPLTGARSVRVKQDVHVVKDYVQDRIRMSNQSWVDEAKAAYTRALKKMRKQSDEAFAKEQRELVPGITEEQIAHGAEVRWNSLDEGRKQPVIETNGKQYLCENEKAFIVAHMTRRANKEAARLPSLYQLKGGVSYDVMGQEGMEKRSDFVNIEYAVRPNGKTFLAVVHGGKKKGRANSPFRSQFCKMKSHRDAFLHIDDFCTPQQASSVFIQRGTPVLPLGAPKGMEQIITEDMTVGEVLSAMSNVGWTVSDNRHAKRQKRQKKPMRKVDMSATRRARTSRKG